MGVMTSWGRPEEFFPSLQQAEEAAKSSLEHQSGQVDALDAKTGILLAASGVILGLLSDNLGRLTVGREYTEYFLLGGLVFLGTTVLTALRSLWLRNFHRAPDPMHLRREYLSSPSGWTRLKVLDTQVEAYGHNEALIGEKAFYLRMAMASFAVSLLVLGATVLYNLF